MNYTRKNLKLLTIVSAIATSIMGVLFHFAYDFFGQNKLAGLIFPTNESTWEHLKLLFFPMLLSLIIGGFFIFAEKSSFELSNSESKHRRSCYITAIAIGIFSGCIAIVVLFYTLNGIIGKTPDWINIGIYFVSVIIAYICFYDYASRPLDNPYEYRCRSDNKESSDCSRLSSWLAILAIAALCILFFIFTIYTPGIGIFISPK